MQIPLCIEIKELLYLYKQAPKLYTISSLTVVLPSTTAAITRCHIFCCVLAIRQASVPMKCVLPYVGPETLIWTPNEQ